MSKEEFVLVRNGVCADFVVEEEAFEGVFKIAQKSAHDVELVTGYSPAILKKSSSEFVVLYATVGKSPLLDKLVKEEKISLSDVEGKREVFGIRLIEAPWEGTKQALVVYGSDKRGTIYGIFTLSEFIGVSPLLFWGDVTPAHQEELVISNKIEQVSKEPSVKYRGFFINDEWPCFGNWTFEHFGGFTKEMYDHVFELLLRLKGNYLWPAMWTSSFAIDGPGDGNAELADTYGVIMGNSHHEPCLRASEEWDLYKGYDTGYGLEWNYKENKDGLLKYWEDGLKRSGKYESIITVGMRGERDSIMQGTNTLKDNIDVLKDIIENQNKLIDEYVNTPEKKVPKLLAVYKEVEQYFYGDAQTEGLKEWEGLDDLILMLCEDNFGNMRALPTEEMLKHKGGYGMYFHLDYHGSPISYEWINSTPLSKIWEQMTQCYEYGVREVWMVNVGDLKGNEFPLSYFMDLAYDFEKWGTKELNSPSLYTKYWVRKQFGKEMDESAVEELSNLITKAIWLIHLRRPEALNSSIYHPAHYREADRMLETIESSISAFEKIEKKIPKEKMDAYYSMIQHPITLGFNLLLIQLHSGKNIHYANQGKKIANHFRDMVTTELAFDKVEARKFAEFRNNKWKGMEQGVHIGFRKWNEDGCRYPVRMEVEPFDRPRLVVSRRDRNEVYVKNYGESEKIEVKDFLYPGNECVELEIANDGIGMIDCQVMGKLTPWISVSWSELEISEQAYLSIMCNRDLLPEKEEKCTLLVTDGDTDVRVEIRGKKCPIDTLNPMTFYENAGITMIHAKNYAKIVNCEDARWLLLEDYGRMKEGLKVYPVTKNFALGQGPSLKYQMFWEEEGKAYLEVWSAPSNPLTPEGRLTFGLRVNSGELQSVPSVGVNYVSGSPADQEWCEGVLNQVHKTLIPISLKQGINEVEIFAEDAGFVLEALLVYKEDKKPLLSYLGPEESWFKSE